MQNKERLLELLKERKHRVDSNLVSRIFPDEGPFRRELYQKHVEFFDAGAEHRERLFIAGNRVGKTIAGGYEIALHLTGEYPHWWQGKRFPRPVSALVAGDTSATTRDIIQVKLLGDTAGGNNIGTGLIPGKRIDKVVPRPGIPGAAESALVRWGKNGQSRLKFRSYEQGRKIFQGTEEDIIWLDEEVPEDVYAEALIRTMTTDGILLMTFTPLQGLTPLVASFLGYDGAAA